MARILIGMETSGMLRTRLEQFGHTVLSVDILPAEDGAANHWPCDVFDAVTVWQPDFGVFHPTCTFHTVSAAWAFKDGPYHQRVKPGTLVGADRRAARDAAEADIERIRLLPFEKIFENPIGTIPTRLGHKPADIIQPYQFGDDASKATCLWAFDANGQAIPFTIPRGRYVEPRLVCRECDTVNTYGTCKCTACHSERFRPCWSNQTNGGQNKLPPGDNRWKDRSRTYPGIADALATAINARLTALPPTLSTLISVKSI